MPRLLSLLSLPAALALLLCPVPARADLDVAFVLDTTGSMSGELQEARTRVRELAEALQAARPQERIRFGVVAYRDRGDAYVTRVSPLSDQVAVTWRFLNGLDAGGGGDAPEDVIAGVQAALTELDWADDAERQLFLVGDAPAQAYDGHPDVHGLAAQARDAGVVVHAIGCRSLSPAGITWFRDLAYATEGQYHHIGRVQADAGGLAEAMLQTLAPAPAADGPLTPLSVHAGRRRGPDPSGAPSSGGVVVRLGAWLDGLEKEPAVPGQACQLTVMLPPGMDLDGPPEVATGTSRLHVTLGLRPGDGQRSTWELGDCLPAATPVEVALR